MDTMLDCSNSPGWDDWHWQLAHAVRRPVELAKTIGLAGPGLGAMTEVARTYPVLVTPYYLSLARSCDAADPILRQCLPDLRELVDRGGLPDPLAEERDSPVPGLVHRYADRVLVVTSSRCAVHCRHCMRKRYWGTDGPLPDLASLARYVHAHPEVREVILSGGDPLLLPDNGIARTIDAFLEIPHVETVRIGSRVPVVLPQRITPGLCDVLSRREPLWLATHFNHPLELTDAAARATRALLRAGVPIVNQTVLLKGVNDDADTLGALFTGLLRLGVKPYYLFHGDPIRGTMHFRTGIARGLEIMRELRGRVSGLAVPAFGLDLPGGQGKVRLEPACSAGVDENGLPRYVDAEGRLAVYPDGPMLEG